MSHLTDARDILFADPADMDTVSDVSEVSLDAHIEAAEWQVEVALANLDACVDDADLDRAAFDLKCAISRMDGLLAKRDARDVEVQRQDTENCALGRLATASDPQDKALAEGGFSYA